MKKIPALLLALGMTASMGANAFAEITSGTEIQDLENAKTKELPVTADVNSYTGEKTPKYSVTVTFDNLKFTYNKGTLGEWNSNGETLAYGTPTDAKWVSDTKEISVESRSNASVYLKCAYAGDSLAGVSGAIQDSETHTLQSAENSTDPTQKGSKQQHTFTLKLTGAPTGETGNDQSVGTVNLTVSKDPIG